MKYRIFAFLTLLALLFTLFPTGASAAQTGRVELSFNNDWRFWRGDLPGGEDPQLDDSPWLYVNTPHSTIQYTPENYYQKDLGVFWYRRRFPTPDTVTGGRRAYLTFDGAMQVATVWLNGVQVGRHEGGYTPFTLDITPHLRTDGGENLLAVKLDTRPNTSVAPGKTNPDFQYFGGLYRNVTLTITQPVHITDAVSSGTVGGGGVFVTTPAVSPQSATVKVRTEVAHDGASPVSVRVRAQLLDADGHTVAAHDLSPAQTLSPGAKTTVTQELTLSNPRLWSPDTPELYTLRTTVEADGVVTDTLDTTCGIRKVEWKRDGCYLNGQRVELTGVNLHSETYMLGNALSDDAIFAEVKRLREYGFNFIRMSHYPHADAFYAACDRYGVAVLDCLAGWQYYSSAAPFVENCKAQMREQVRANRNHPCVVAWEPSLNESNFDRTWAEAMDAVTREEYPADGVSRAWTGGWKHWSAYDLGVGTPQANVNTDAANNPTMPAIVSEYGDWNMGGFNSSSRVTREPTTLRNGNGVALKGGDEGMLIHCDNVQSSYAWNRQFDWFGADAYWQYADYAGFDTAVLTYCGVVDVARIPKFAAYFYQSQRDPDIDLSPYGLSSGPMVFIANTWAEDSPTDVRVYSNCDEVALYYDGVLIARQTPDTTMWDPRAAHGTGGGAYPTASSGATVSTSRLKHPPFTFHLSGKTPGTGTLRAVAYLRGEEVASFTRCAPGAPAALTLTPEDTLPLKLDGSTAKLVWFDVVDANGTVVNTADNAVTFTVDGPGLVIGEKTVAARGGRWAVWVRSKRGSGDITLTASAPGLTGTTLTIPTQQVPGLPAVPEGGDADETGFVPPQAPVNVFLNRPVTASSVNVAGGGNMEKAEYANDGDPATKWCAAVTDNGADSSVGPHWWQVDLGVTTQVDRVDITFDTYNAAHPYRYQIVFSPTSDFSWYDPAAHEDLVSTAQTMSHPVAQDGRYVRVYINCPASTIWPCVYEIAGYGSVNNVALGKTASAPGSASGSDPGMAVDGDVSRFWNRGGGGPGWWQVDLGADYHITDAQVTFAWADTSDNGVIRHAFTLQSSLDGTHWEDVASWSDREQSDGVANPTATLPVDRDARYLRVNALYAYKESTGASQWIEIAEFVAVGRELELQRMDYGAYPSASSNAPGITPAYGNDGDPESHWTPASQDAAPWRQFDAGGEFRLRSAVLSWTGAAPHRYALQTSLDGKTWTTVADHLSSGVPGGDTTDLLPLPSTRYLRVQVPQGTTEGFWVNVTGVPVSKVEADLLSCTFENGTARCVVLYHGPADTPPILLCAFYGGTGRLLSARYLPQSGDNRGWWEVQATEPSAKKVRFFLVNRDFVPYCPPLPTSTTP